jgi:hypothetical protein
MRADGTKAVMHPLTSEQLALLVTPAIIADLFLFQAIQS